ncbi:MAG: hypothetical protein ABR564_09500, partial [Candidatus Dormibacteria bacterium]
MTLRAAWSRGPVRPAAARGRGSVGLAAAWSRGPVGLAAVLVVAERLVLGVAGWLLAGPMQAASPALLSSLVDRPGTLAAAVVGPWQRDDGLWYQLIAQAGYGAHPADAAFFPLYP